MLGSFKIALLSVCAFASVAGMLPPTPRAREDQTYIKGRFETIGRGLAYVCATIIGLAYAGEVFALLQLRRTSAERQQRVFEFLCPASTVASWPTSTTATHLLDVQPMFLLSACLGLAGGVLRLWCYRTLGRFFTYEAAMSDGHVLVTHGPYSVVRHPSYTGVAMIVLGKTLEFFCPGSYVRECGVAGTWAGWALYAFVATTLYIVYSLFARIPVEDAQLEAKFGKEWEVYRRAVPYKLVPFLI